MSGAASTKAGEAASCSGPFDCLAHEVLDRGGCLRFKVGGYSMYPLIHNGDTVLVEPKRPVELEVGDIVLYQGSSGNYVVHRLVQKNSLFLTTRGDNLNYCDAPISGDWVMGKVVQIESCGKRVKLTGWTGRMLGRCVAWLARGGRGPTRARLRRHLSRFYWTVFNH